tara:strand:- start:131 stop:613 length:483 start_codon:yes stop_codon:yes gene_type:complete
MTNSEILFDNLFTHLDEEHQKKLIWSLNNKNLILPWSEISRKKMAIIPKGIYKPQGSNYALSVKTTIDGPYDDGDVFVQPSSGEWMAIYRPERDKDAYTNRALKECQKDLIPIIYFKQTSKKPNTAYRNIGPCLSWYEKKSNYFFLFGFSDNGKLSNHIF